MKNRKLLWSGLPFAALVLPQGAALAQGSADIPIDDIIVTAQKREQSLIDVPATVNVFSGETLEKFKIFDIREISALSPGLSLQNITGGEPAVTLRGVPYNPNSGAPDTVDIYVNEVTFLAEAAFEALYDVGQMEVLRGPQGSLRGRTSPAGAIIIGTRRPSLDKVEGFVQGSISDDSLYNVQGGVSVPIVTDKLAVRVAGLIDRNRLDHVRNINTGEYNRRWVDSMRGTVAFQPTENLSLTAMYQFIDSKKRITRQVIGEGSPLSGYGPLTAQDRVGVADGAGIFRRKSHLGTLLGDLDLGGVVINYIGSYQRNSNRMQRDQDFADAVPDYSNQLNLQTRSKLISQELRIASQGENFWNWTVGAYYERLRVYSSVTQRSDSFFPPLTVPVFSIGIDVQVPSKSDKMAIFLTNRFNLTDQLKLEAGIRFNRFKTYRQSVLTLDIPGMPLPPIPTIAPQNERLKETPITGNASLSYKFSPNATAYASYGRSYRPGNPAAGLITPLGQDLLFTNSERSDQVEVGFKGRTWDSKLSFSVAAYYQKFDGFINNIIGVYYRNPLTSATDSNFDFNFNGDATIKGVELQADLRPSNTVTLGINASYARGRYDNAPAPCNDFNQDGTPDAVGTPVITPGQDVSRCAINGRVAEEPDFTLTLLPSFRHPIGSLEGFLNGTFSLRPAFTSQAVKGYRYPAQESLNLFAGIRSPDGRWELTVWGKNIFNQTRIFNITDSNFSQGPFSSGYRLAAVTQPREFGLTGKFDF